MKMSSHLTNDWSEEKPTSANEIAMTVLIIDDDPEETTLFCEAFNELYPYGKCLAANSCENICQIIDEESPEIIFVDGHMYPTSGRECLQLLNSVVDRTRVKIIIHSGSLSPKE